MLPEYDIVILGGGCSGLSLAMHLCKIKATSPRVLIIESRAQYTNDRTWCFWETPSSRSVEMSEHKWPSFLIKTMNRSYTAQCSELPYCMISSETFYNKALELIYHADNITLRMGESIDQSPYKINNHWKLTTSKAEYTTSYVIDTRPYETKEKPILWQSFYGREIEVNTDTFDETKATLMDFEGEQPSLICFTYLLTLSKKRALIEVTVFDKNPFQKEALEERLKAAIAKYTEGKPYNELRSEHGILPMGQMPSVKSKDPTYLRVGLFAGAARASTGYAYQRIQNWAYLCANAIAKTGRPCLQPSDSWIQLRMDNLFLHVLAANPAVGPSLFLKMFERCDTSRVIRFLSDQAQLLDYLAIVLVLPPKLFLRQLIDLYLKRLIKREPY